MAKYSKARITRLFRTVDTAATADARGAALEAATGYLFETIPGVAIEDTNILGHAGAHELDLALSNDQRVSDIYFLEAILIVECKAHMNPVSSHDVAWFITKLRTCGSRNGILVAMNGITGDPDDLSAAYSQVNNALVGSGIKVLILTRTEIESLSTSTDLAQLLQRKLVALTLKGTVVIDEA